MISDECSNADIDGAKRSYNVSFGEILVDNNYSLFSLLKLATGVPCWDSPSEDAMVCIHSEDLFLQSEKGRLFALSIDHRHTDPKYSHQGICSIFPTGCLPLAGPTEFLSNTRRVEQLEIAA